MRGKKVTNLRNKLNGVNERFNIKNSKYHAKCLQLNKAYQKIEIMREVLTSIAWYEVDLDNLKPSDEWMDTARNDSLMAREALKKVDELK